MIKSAWATVSTCVMLSTITATSACAPTSTCMRVHEYVGDAEHNRELKVYIKDFFARLNLPNVLKRKKKKKILDSDFPPPCFDVPKASNFTSGGVQNRETKTRRLGTIVISFQDSKLREKQIPPTFFIFL